jgi:hypothetical protein
MRRHVGLAEGVRRCGKGRSWSLWNGWLLARCFGFCDFKNEVTPNDHRHPEFVSLTSVFRFKNDRIESDAVRNRI